MLAIVTYCGDPHLTELTGSQSLGKKSDKHGLVDLFLDARLFVYLSSTFPHIWIITGLRFLSFEYIWPQPISEGSFRCSSSRNVRFLHTPFFGVLEGPGTSVFLREKREPRQPAALPQTLPLD